MAEMVNTLVTDWSSSPQQKLADKPLVTSATWIVSEYVYDVFKGVGVRVWFGYGIGLELVSKLFYVSIILIPQLNCGSRQSIDYSSQS